MRIEVKTYNIYVPAKFLDEGKFILDYDEEFAITREKISEAKIKSIDTDKKITLTLPRTKKNDYLYRNGKEWEVDIWIGYRVYELHKLIFSFKAQNYEVVIKRSDDHWLAAIERTFLKDIDYGDFTYDIFSIVRSNLNKDTYNETDDNGYYVPTVDYGNLSKKDHVNYLQQRPFISPLRLLQKGFCMNGWKFRCPFLESERGRSIWTYDWEDGFIDVDIFKKQKEFRVHTNNNANNIGVINDSTGNRIIYFEDEIYDPSDRFTQDIYYTPVSETRILYVEGVIKIEGGANRRDKIFIEIIEDNNGNENIVGVQEILLRFTEKTEFIVDIETEILVDDSSKYYARYWVVESSIEVLSLKLYFYNKVVTNAVEDGDTINYKKTIDQSLNVKKYLEGIAHLMDGYIHPDIVNKTIWLYSAFDTYVGDANTQPIDGFYIENNKEIGIFQENSIQVKNKKENKERFDVYAFKKGSDTFIESKKLPPQDQPYSRIIDKLTGKKDYKYFNNPLFEPTINNEYFKLSRDASFNIGDYPIVLPVMRDNEDGELSKNIGHRIVIGCFAKQVGDDGNNLLLAHKYKGGGGGLSKFPMAYQGLDYEINDLRKNDLKLVYQDRKFIGFPSYDKFDLWNTFIKKSYYLNTDNVSILRFVTNREVLEEDFRSFWNFNIWGNPVILVLDKINSHIVNSKLSTPYEFKIKGSGVTCTPEDKLDYRDADETCANYPILTKERNAGCYDLSITGDYDSTIDGNVVFKYRTKNGDGSWGAWQSIANITATTAKLCISEIAMIRATISWVEDCDDKILITQVAPCGDNNPELLYEIYINEDNEYCVMVTIGGDMVDSYTIVSFTYVKDGGASTNYTEGTTVCDINNQIQFDAELDFGNGCDNKILQLIVDVPPTQIDCGKTTAGLECEVTGGCFSFNRTGNLAFEFVTDIIEYQCSVDGLTWDSEIKRWDGEEICACNYVRARRIINFCEDKCPMYCTEWVYCNPPSCPCNYQILCDTNDRNGHIDVISGCVGFTYTWYDPNGTAVGTGTTHEFTIDGTYTVIADNGTCTVTKTYDFTAPEAGTPIDDPIIVE